MPIRTGDNAPDFTLPRAGGDPVTLSQYRGSKNVVVLFFPLAWSRVCTAELCSIRDDYSRWTELDAEILGISVDSPFALAAWSKEQGFEFPLLSDFNRSAVKSYDVLLADLVGLHDVARRAAFVIDKSGVVRYAEVCASPGDMPSFDKVRETLAGLA